MKRFLTLLAFVALTITANAAVIQSGSCGDNVTFVLNDDGTLVISGSGEMENYSIFPAPWSENKEKIIKVQIEDGVTSIGSGAFNGCSGLTSVTIPNSVTSIGNYVFSGCSSLPVIDNLRYADTYLVEAVDKNCSSANFKEGTRFIGDSAFYGCSGLTSVTIPNSVKSIGNYAFYGCSGLTSVTIPNSAKSIGNYAFTKCDNVKELIYAEGCTTALRTYLTSITSVTIPNSVTRIYYAFYGCSKLKEIHSQAIAPPMVEGRGFEDVSTNYCKLYVPMGARENYAFAEGWKDFMNIIEESIISDGDNKCAAPTIEFVDGHLKFSSATPNATFSYTITDEDIKTSLQECVSGDLPLTATYNITVYAFAEGYDASNATTATLHWIDGTLDCADGIKSIGTKRAVLVSSRDGKVKTSGLSDGEKVEAYTIDGKYIGCAYSVDDAAYISAQSGEVVVLKIGKESIKTIVK